MEFKSLTHDGKLIIYKESFWTGKREIIIDGNPVKKVKKNNYIYDDEVYSLKGSFLFGSQLVKNDNKIILVPKLTALEIVFVILPLILVFIGGAVGGLCGALAAIIFAAVARSVKSSALKIVLGISVTLCAFVVWYFVATVLLVMISGAA